MYTYDNLSTVQVEFAVDDANWAYNLRQEDFIVNEPLQYPRPRIMKRQATPPKYAITLTGLWPNSPIKAQVRVLNKYYAGPQSNQVTFTTPEGGQKLTFLLLVPLFLLLLLLFLP